MTITTVDQQQPSGPSMDEIFPKDIETRQPPGVEPKKEEESEKLYYDDFWLDREHADRTEKYFLDIIGKVKAARFALIKMREGVDSKVVPSSQNQVGLFHTLIQQIGEEQIDNVLMKIWLEAKNLGWNSVHEAAALEFYNAGKLFGEAFEEYRSIRRDFKELLEPRYLKRYKGIEGETNSLARQIMVKDWGWKFKAGYDRIRDLVWHATSNINATVAGLKLYEESGGGMTPWMKAQAEIQLGRDKQQTTVQTVVQQGKQ